jgi:hypothetical protein
MDTGPDDRPVDLRDDLQGSFILSSDDFGDGLEAMFFVAGIDALR